jgi:CRISPR-associated helicase Cas3/CRISPR-associated endonuclease Cas3-HD
MGSSEWGAMQEPRLEIWAHSPNSAGLWHGLGDHLRNTAELASRFAEPFNGGQVAWWLGLLHDAGKASCEWQARLREVAGSNRPVGLPHKFLGAQLARDRGLASFALAISGHHGGLTSAAELADQLRSPGGAGQSRQVDAMARLRAVVPELADSGRVPLPPPWREALVREMAVRMCFSALCDADFLDTSAHFSGSATPLAGTETDFGELRDRFEWSRKQLLAARRPSTVDGVREEIYQACVRAAAAEPGVFRLAAPTGSGKTISAGAFALHHAAAHGLRRVIVAVPFLTITEQNAEVYRNLLEGPGAAGVVLEHHSGADLDRPSQRWAKLAADNWDAPFIVTTTVRLFESLFDRRPAAMRRLHRLAGAVIVLDEVQSLPHQMLVPILDALRTLVGHFGATVVLSSATQPDFWHLSPWRDLPAAHIISEPEVLVSRLRRVDFEWRLDPGQDLAGLAADAAASEQAMVVVNTTADARTVLEAWRSTVPAKAAWHLSTRMCAAHRRRVLAEVRGRLEAGEPVLLVSTQLIEAGVDIDFPVVYRVLAPADSLLQAAGRANREGKLPGKGKVIIVDPVDASQPPAYRKLVAATRTYFGPAKADPDNPAALRGYYQHIYGSLNLENEAAAGQKIQQARRLMDFRAVTDGPADPVTGRPDRRYAFRMITDDGIALVTPQGAADQAEQASIEALADRVRSAARPDRQDLRDLQPYVTTIHPSAARRPGVLAMMRPILGEPGQPGSLAEWVGGYDRDTAGIDLDPHTEEFVC